MAVQPCARCGFENRTEARFCGSCGERLERRCPACGTPAEPGLAFCTACGASLVDDVAAEPLEERKFVSVLFADLVGFTSRAESLDPEDIRRLLRPYHARLREELERFGGTVEKMIGDAVVGFFGAPTAHEDDPERAVRAALVVREAINELNAADPTLGLQVRVGVTTGEAVIALHARPEAGEQIGAGDVVNTAARLQGLAAPGSVLVDEATYRATEAAVDYGEPHEVELRGKTLPVTVREALAPRARLGVDIAFRGRAPLIGRRDELDVLLGALVRAERERSSQLVTLVGVPGIGKSRLVYELFAAIEAGPELRIWRQGRSLPYGGGVSFWALGEMVKAQSGILETDTADAAETKLGRAVASLTEDPGERRRLLGQLRPLAGLGPRESELLERRDEAFGAWRRFFELLAEQRPLVLVFEDIHWADDGLLDFVDELVDWTAGVPLLVVATARPELLERRPGWGGGKRNASTISLAPLSDEETAQLFEALTAEADSDVVARAGGNPLYAEEYARMLSHRGKDGEIPLPESVLGIIAARLDTLPPEEKALVQDAAVVGKVFWTGALAALGGLDPQTAEERIHALERKEFVRRERRSSFESEVAYVFRHGLVGDVAYGRIPRARRADRHRLAAEWLASVSAGRAEDAAELLAHHYVSALEYAEGVGEDTTQLRERARVALLQAGDRASALSAFAPAARFYGRALELWPEDDGRPQLLLRLGRALYHGQGTGTDVLREAAEELLDAGERAAAAEAEIMLAELAWLQGQSDAVSLHLQSARSLVADERASPAKAYVLANLSRFLSNADELEAAIRAGFEAYRMAEDLEHDELLAHTLITIGTSRALSGDLGGLVDLERAIATARRADSSQSARGLNNLATATVHLGHLGRAFELYAEAREEAERFGHVVAMRWLAAERVIEFYWRGLWDESLAVADEFSAGADRGSPSLQEVEIRAVRAKIQLARAGAADAGPDAARALDLAREADDAQSLFPALAAAAHVALAAGRVEEASALVDELLSHWDETGRLLPSWWLTDLALVLESLGRGDELQDSLERIALATPWLDAAASGAQGAWLRSAGLFAEIGSLPDEAFARLRAAEDLLGAGRKAEAEGPLAAALAFYREVRADELIRRAEGALVGAGTSS